MLLLLGGSASFFGGFFATRPLCVFFSAALVVLVRGEVFADPGLELEALPGVAAFEESLEEWACDPVGLVDVFVFGSPRCEDPTRPAVGRAKCVSIARELEVASLVWRSSAKRTRALTGCFFGVFFAIPLEGGVFSTVLTFEV